MKTFLKVKNIEIERRMLEGLKTIDVKDPKFKYIIILLSTFQRPNGSFDLIRRSNIPNDVEIYYCDEPTYICTSLYIKALNDDENWFFENIGYEKLSKALEICSKHNLMGHGYDGLGNQIKNIKLFIDNGLHKYLNNHPEINLSFMVMIDKILRDYKKRIKDRNFNYGFGCYENQIKEVLDLYEK